MTGLLLFSSNSNIRKTATTILDRDHFFDIMSQKDADRMANIVNPDGTGV